MTYVMANSCAKEYIVCSVTIQLGHSCIFIFQNMYDSHFYNTLHIFFVEFASAHILTFYIYSLGPLGFVEKTAYTILFVKGIMSHCTSV